MRPPYLAGLVLLLCVPTFAAARSMEPFRVPGAAEGVLVTLSLRVEDETGRPLERVQVTIQKDGEDLTEFDLDLEEAERQVELRVPPGHYRVTVRHPTLESASREFDVESTAGTTTSRLVFRLLLPVQTAPPPLSSPPPHPTPPETGNGHPKNGSPKKDVTTVAIFYATNRGATHHAKPSKAFGSEWRDTISYGTAFVTIPPEHHLGAFERPSIWRFEFRENPKKHVVFDRYQPMASKAFYASMRAALAQLAEPRCMLYIHGYNVSFEGAMLRAGQLYFDLALPMVPVAYSWPSAAQKRKYPADETTVENAAKLVRDFMLELRRETGVKAIDVITHSMGARAIGYALEGLARTGAADSALVGELILSAPDVDQRRMKTWIETFRPLIGRVTLYGSKKDVALWLSETLHNAPRAGDGGPDVFVHPQVETVDATNVPTDFLNHTQPGNGAAVTSDAYYVMRHARVGERCCLQSLTKDGLTYWELKPRK